MSDYDVLKLETGIEDVKMDRTSSNGNDYTALVLPNQEWVFVWNDDWREEIKERKSFYMENKVELYVVDKEEDEDDHWYHLKALLPQSQEKAREILETKIKQERAKNKDINNSKIPQDMQKGAGYRI